jgi:hypothetical protein
MVNGPRVWPPIHFALIPAHFAVDLVAVAGEVVGGKDGQEA